jgi:gentisate 1,2-dioxygenase
MDASRNGTQLDALSRRSGELHVAEFWRDLRGAGRPPTEPSPSCEAHLWRFDEVIPQLWEAAHLVPVEEAERRAVIFKNPGLDGRIATTPTMYAAYSLYNPGEHAPVHRHTINAGRIGLSGTGGYTTVNGIKCMLARGDLVLTPSWCWHDHGNDGAEPNIWFDILDAPLSNLLSYRFFDFDYREEAPGPNVRIQTPKAVIAATSNPYGSGSVQIEGGIADKLPPGHTIFFDYRQSRATLEAMKHVGVDAFEGVTARLVNGQTGGPATQTMEIRLRLLPGGGETRPVRHSAGTVFLVMEGRGHTIVGDRRLDWRENDVFVVPNWTWCRHVNDDPSNDAVFYAMSDEPLIRNVGGWRREGLAADGSRVPLE